MSETPSVRTHERSLCQVTHCLPQQVCTMLHKDIAQYMLQIPVNTIRDDAV